MNLRFRLNTYEAFSAAREFVLERMVILLWCPPISGKKLLLKQHSGPATHTSGELVIKHIQSGVWRRLKLWLIAT